MNHPDYNSPAALRAFLDGNGMAMQKKFGQNFLVNGRARSKLIDSLDVSEGTKVWEVGPGLGCMTYEILERGGSVTAFEIDRGFARLLKELFSDYSERGSFSLVEGDVLRTWRKHFDENGSPDRFFGNLPYNIAAAIIADTISGGLRFERAVVTIQKEVAQRMRAKEGTESYSSFSVLCQWAYDIKNLLDLAGGNFWPAPNVASRALLLTRREDFPRCGSPNVFMMMIRRLFSLRRKTIRNNMLSIAGPEKTDEVLKAAGIEPGERVENLSVGTLLSLSDALAAILKEE